MRKKLWIGALTLVLGSVAGYWYYSAKKPTLIVDDPGVTVTPPPKNGGDTEESELIEPLRVEVRQPFDAPTVAPPDDDGPPPRVVLEPDVEQPPRPDAEPGTKLRMPYADEEKGLGLTPYPELKIGSGLARFNIFELIDNANPAEEPETKVAPPPADPLPPIPNYHHQHCPHHGGCPAPFVPRAMPRN